MKMIVKLLLVIGLWLSVIDLNNVKHLKKNQNINACSMVSYKVVRLVHTRRCEKTNKTIFN